MSWGIHQGRLGNSCLFGPSFLNSCLAQCQRWGRWGARTSGAQPGEGKESPSDKGRRWAALQRDCEGRLRLIKRKTHWSCLWLCLKLMSITVWWGEVTPRNYVMLGRSLHFSKSHFPICMWIWYIHCRDNMGIPQETLQSAWHVVGPLFLSVIEGFLTSNSILFQL